MQTVRDIITDFRREIRDTDLQPDRAAEILTKLSALLGNCNDEIRLRDVEYSKVLLKWYQIETKANRAKIKAETSPEYEAKCLARNTKEEVEAMIGTLKYFLRGKEDEFRKGKFQT